MTNSVDPVKMALYELSHLVLHCLQWYMICSAGLKELTCIDKTLIPFMPKGLFGQDHF